MDGFTKGNKNAEKHWARSGTTLSPFSKDNCVISKSKDGLQSHTRGQDSSGEHWNAEPKHSVSGPTAVKLASDSV